MSTQITFVLHFMNKHECGTQSAWMRLWLLRSHGTERIFDRLQNLSGHFVHSGSFNIFALFTLYFERLVRLKFCTIEVIPCKRKSLHTRIFNRPKIRPVPCERRQYRLRWLKFWQFVIMCHLPNHGKSKVAAHKLKLGK